jgi:CRISPR-associated protein Csx10
VDDVGRPTLDPVPEIVRVLGLPASAVRGKHCWTRPVRVGGWHAASGLPKPAELAIELGSVVVLHCSEQPSTERLRHLAREGIGLRRIEGFGSVEVNPPPWRLVQVPPDGRAAAEEGPSALAGLRDHGLLDDETVMRWLVDRSRLVLVELERDRSFSVEPLFQERVPMFFDDDQADAVRALFASPRLPAAIPLLEQELDRITAGQGETAPGGNR